MTSTTSPPQATEPSERPPSGGVRRVLRARRDGLESLAALVACAAVSLAGSLRILRPENFSLDALVHQYWMWSFRDPQLFADPLTAQLRESSRYPEGYEALFRLAVQVFDPIAFGEWVGLGLMAVSAWLVFLIVREHGGWRPSAWIAAGLFLALIEAHRFFGGFPRAFVHPVVLLTVLLAMRRRHLAAGLVAAGGALFYPTASLLALGVLVVSAVRWSDRRPRLEPRRAAFTAMALVLAAAAVLLPQLAAGGAPRVFTAEEARVFPEFGEDGGLHFFVDSTVEYLRQNRSGFDLRASGSILALAALALLLVRRRNVTLLRREVLAMPVVALAGFAAAHAVLFQLYLPHRFTYPLVAFFAIAVGVALHPTWTALWPRARARWRALALLFAPVPLAAVAVQVFPLGPVLSLDDSELRGTWMLLAAALAAAGVLALLLSRLPARGRAAAGAAVTGVSLIALMVGYSDHLERGTTCPTAPATDFLGSLPKDAVIAGDPSDLTCVPGLARRPVVISTQLAPSYEVDYFFEGRERMFAALRAQYGASPGAIADLRARYGATHLWVRRGDVVREALGGPGSRWEPDKRPYGPFVRRLVAEGRPAVLALPEACLRFREAGNEVYDIACIARRLGRAGEDGTRRAATRRGTS